MGPHFSHGLSGGGLVPSLAVKFDFGEFGHEGNSQRTMLGSTSLGRIDLLWAFDDERIE